MNEYGIVIEKVQCKGIYDGSFRFRAKVLQTTDMKHRQST